MSSRCFQAGMSLLEVVFAVIAISILIVFFFGRIVQLSVDIERENMAQTLNFLHGALKMEMLSYALQQKLHDLGELERANPMVLLAETPANYFGEYAKPDAQTMPSGGWYFDTQESLLVYRVRNQSHFSGGAPGAPRARFRVQLKFDDSNGNGRYDENDDLQGVVLNPVEPYEWLTRSSTPADSV